MTKCNYYDTEYKTWLNTNKMRLNINNICLNINKMRLNICQIWLNTNTMRLNINKMWLNINKMRLNVNKLRLNTYNKRDVIFHHLSNHIYSHNIELIDVGIRCHSFSFVFIHFHSLSFVITCCTIRCQSMYHSSVLL